MPRNYSGITPQGHKGKQTANEAIAIANGYDFK
jgi:hypothetical protein